VTQQQAQIAARAFADRIKQLDVAADVALDFAAAALRH
jgi:hypothetical protein